MSEIERWWRVTTTRGDLIWTPRDPRPDLDGAWADAAVAGPFVLEADELHDEGGQG
jgi:hypothetical protein